MKKKEFSKVRNLLGKTQKQLALLLGVSLKAVQSFEQGWREIPTHVERQMLFLLGMKNTRKEKASVCWEVKKCQIEIREKCPAWEFQCGHLCWFINGTICIGEEQKSWQKKMKICRQCEVFHSAQPDL